VGEVSSTNLAGQVIKEFEKYKATQTSTNLSIRLRFTLTCVQPAAQSKILCGQLKVFVAVHVQYNEN